jgi:hypothetical protein
MEGVAEAAASSSFAGFRGRLAGGIRKRFLVRVGKTYRS